MNFSDIKKPAAASAIIKDFQRKFSAKVCLAPSGDCSGSIIAAHTLSVEGMLRPISRDGHVYANKVNLYQASLDAPSAMLLLGIHKTSVFNGFCAAHDKALFSSIEDQPFICTYQQLFMHAYRAVSKESYLKRKQAESLPSPDDVREIHGVPNPLVYSGEALIHMAASLRGAEEIERAKAKMDEHLVAGDWRRIVTTVIPFKKPPTVVCNYVYAPAYDFEGNDLQDFNNLDVDLSYWMVTVLPTDTGGFALFSYPDTANAAPRRLVESLTSREDITSSLVWTIFCQTENFALSPIWYESLSGRQITAINEAFFSNVDLINAAHNKLRACNLVVESWEPGKPFIL